MLNVCLMSGSGPRVVDERIGDRISEEDVFADAVCEFSSSVVSDSVKEKEEEETPANGMAKSATDLGEFYILLIKQFIDIMLPLMLLFGETWYSFCDILMCLVGSVFLRY